MTRQWLSWAWRVGVALVAVAIASGVARHATTPADASTQEIRKMAQSVSLEVLSQLKGKVYLEERDRFLQDPAQIQAALTHLQDTVWRVRIQAKIIQGWATESTLYRQILSELD